MDRNFDFDPIKMKLIDSEDKLTPEILRWQHVDGISGMPDLHRLVRQKGVSFWTYWDRDRFVAADIAAVIDDSVWFTYWIAVMPEFRSMGYGTKVVSLIVERASDFGLPYMLLFDDPNQPGIKPEEKETRIRRKNFYKKLNFRILDDKKIRLSGKNIFTPAVIGHITIPKIYETIESAKKLMWEDRFWQD